MTVQADLLLQSADLTRSSDTDYPTGSVWFDTDAEAGGVTTATVSGPVAAGTLPAAASWTQAPGYPRVTVTPPAATGGLVTVTAHGTVTGTSGLRLRLSSDCGDWLSVEVAVPGDQAVTLSGNGRLEVGESCDVWVEYQGSATGVSGGVLVPVFYPAGLRPGAQADERVRYFDGAVWQPPVLQAASMDFE